MPPRVEHEQNLQLSKRIVEDADKEIQQQNQSSTEQLGDALQPELAKSPQEYRVQIVWRNVAIMSALHIGALMGVYACFTSAQWKTVVLGYLLYVAGGLGITAGAHRLWSHRSYKATWQLRLILAFLQSLAFENSIFEWSRDHRVHHKFSETDADPHNALRGFFFSHMGWLLCRKHKDVITKGKLVDMSDLIADPIVRVQHRYYLPIVMTVCFVLPTLMPWYLWGETLYNSFYICALLRYTITLHATWTVNSIAHMWGRKPYDKSINPAENKSVSFMALGEGFHNYHHTFPWDYATSELGYDINLTKLFIDFMAKIGWAYERKVVSPEMIKQRKLRTGDTGDKGAYGPHNYEHSVFAERAASH